MSDITKYCFDTSAWLHGWVRSYPPDILPPLWEKISDLIEKKIIISPFDVYQEIEKKEGDKLYQWCKERNEMFYEIDEYQDQISQIMTNYPRLVDTKKGKSGADPMVIALAKYHGPSMCVVTEEKGGSDKSPKIPSVCEKENIRCLTLLEMIRDQKWTFTG